MLISTCLKYTPKMNKFIYM